MDGQQYVNKIIRMEELSRDFSIIRDKLGIKEKLEHINQGGYKHPIREIPVAELYDDEMIQAVLDAYGEDFELFGYKTKPE